MNIEAVEHLLTDAIDQWMRVPTTEMQYAFGNAQGIARSLAALKSSTFTEEWSAGMDRYQGHVCEGQ